MIVITVDGPSASGKSTAARDLARKLGFYYLNTGLLFRAIGYLLILKDHYSLDQLDHVQCEDLHDILNAERIVYMDDEVENRARIFFDGVDITQHLKSREIDQAASIVSKDPNVRETVLAFEKDFATKHNIVTDGRDLGTIVYPHAQVKFYLTASVEERARRWLADKEKKGEKFTQDEAVFEITSRDARDRERSESPLVAASDAYVIDNTHLTQEETLATMMEIIKQKGL